MHHSKSLVVFVLMTFSAALIGSTALPDAWYAGLAKPPFNPPNWIFAPVWTLLYIIIAVAAWRIYTLAGIGTAILLWIAQLILNASWSPLFFDAHRIDLALVDISLMLMLIVITTVAFFRRERLAGALMLPYLAWVSFATLLTFSIWRLNG